MNSSSFEAKAQGSVLDAFQVELLAGLQPYGQQVRFPPGSGSSLATRRATRST